MPLVHVHMFIHILTKSIRQCLTSIKLRSSIKKYGTKNGTKNGIGEVTGVMGNDITTGPTDGDITGNITGNTNIKQNTAKNMFLHSSSYFLKYTA